MKTKTRRLTQLSVMIGLLCNGIGAQAIDKNCNVTNLHYVEGNTLQVPCVQVGDNTFSATFKILPDHLWELLQATQISTILSGARSTFSNNALEIPLIQLTDGSIWSGTVRATDQKSASGNMLFKLNNPKKLTATADLGKVVFMIGNQTDVRRANANANANANKNNGNGNSQNNTDNGNSGNNGAQGNQSPLNITAAVLKVDHIELTGSSKTTLKVSGEIDLLKVIQGQPQLLGEVVLPANTHISQVRLILADGSYVTADGEKYPLEVPSGEQTGLKINGDWGITGGQITSVQLDFNADDIRFNKAQGYRIKPTVKVANVEMKALPVDSDGNPTDDLLAGKPFILTVGDKLRFELPEGVHPAPDILYGDTISTSNQISEAYILGPNGEQFSSPGTITINYDETKIPVGYVEKNIVVLQDGQAIPSLVNIDNNTVSAQISHFSNYAAALVHNCDFIDIDYSNPNQAWMSSSIKQLCKDAIIQGYFQGNNVWKYEPDKTATLLEVLKVFLSSSKKSCVRYIDANSVDKLISDAQNRLDRIFLPEELNGNVSREMAINFLALLFYDYFGSDVVYKMTLLGITNGEDLDANITRAELAVMADRARNIATAVDGQETSNACSTNISFRKAAACMLVHPVNVTVSRFETDFSWGQVSGATRYRLLISQNSEFSGFDDTKADPSKCDSTCATKPLESTNFSRVMSLYDQAYYWQVRSDKSDWSTPSKFTTALEEYTYRPNYAAEYAVAYYDKGYPKDSFADYQTINNANCTHFASQAVLAGFLGTSDRGEVFKNRGKRADKKGDYQWYYTSRDYAASNWKGAKEFYSYVQKQDQFGNFAGPHFKYVTNDTLNAHFAPSLVKVGDIIFADWETDGVIDHTMIVTAKTSDDPKYEGIEVTYQNSPGHDPRKRSLASVNAQMKYKSTFYVYRPTHYIP